MNPKIQQIKSRLEAAKDGTEMYKNYPMFVVNFMEDEKYESINRMIQFGHEARADITFLLSHIERLERALSTCRFGFMAIDALLTCPAAEYVPAISDAFAQIDKTCKEVDQILEEGAE